MINLTIDGRAINVEEGTSILNAAKKLGIKIPTLCHMNLHDMEFGNKEASCRICVVELGHNGKLVPACAEKVWEGMEVKTRTKKVLKTRKDIVELLLANHPKDCLTCDRNLNCELQDLSNTVGLSDIKYEGEVSEFEIDKRSKSIVRDPNKCILCNRCTTMCNEVQTVGAISGIGRGFESYIGTSYDTELENTTCTFCGQCVAVCPTGALREVDNIDLVWEALKDDSKHVVVQTAPAIRVALGEMFGMDSGVDVTGKMVASLRALGFNSVFDTNFAADLTIIEEANEFVERYKNKGKLPMMTSCCPAWINFVEQEFPQFVDNPSTCKSPHQMLGAILKNYYSKKINIDPKDMVVVSVMPCIAKKYESNRDELTTESGRDVDIVITTRELGRMIKEVGLDFINLEDEEFDNPLGESTGAGTIFGATGGVLEATMRTSYEWLTGENLTNLEFTSVRGLEGIKEASFKINEEEIKVAAVNGLGQARKLLAELESGESEYHVIEVMACPGGCIDGGGQPYHRGDSQVIKNRMQAIYKKDKDKKIRQSHKNPMIIELYDEYLEKPGSSIAHDLLHTKFKKRIKL